MSGVDETPAPSQAGFDMRRRWRSVLDTITSVAIIAAVVALCWQLWRLPSQSPQQPNEPPLPRERQTLEGATLRGNPSARVALIEYSDFQCEFCGVFAREVMPVLERDYITPGSVLLAFRNLPLPIHPLARDAAKGALCAGEQGQFWQAHDEFYRKQSTLDFAGMLESIGRVGGNQSRWSACMLTNGSPVVQRDLESAERLGIRGTPYFLLGTRDANGVTVKRVLAGARPLSVFKAAIDGVLDAP